MQVFGSQVFRPTQVSSLRRGPCLVFGRSRLDDSSALLQECRITRFGKKIAAKNCDDKWVLILHHHWKSIRNDGFVSRHLFLIKFVNFSAVTAIASSALLRTNQTPSVWGVSVLCRSILSPVGYFQCKQHELFLYHVFCRLRSTTLTLISTRAG